MLMISRYCTICGKHFMAYGNTRTCSASCKYKQMKITQEEGARRRRERMRKGKSTLVEIQQKAREAGMSYGRNSECHCDCAKYIEYKKQLEEMKKKKETQNMISNACFSLVDHRLKSLKKKQVQRGMK